MDRDDICRVIMAQVQVLDAGERLMDLARKLRSDAKAVSSHGVEGVAGKLLDKLVERDRKYADYLKTIGESLDTANRFLRDTSKK